MACRFCKSPNVRVFAAEMNVHLPGIENLDTPSVWVFPPVTICLHCGCSDFVVHGEPLQELRARSLGRGLHTASSSEQPE